MKLTILIENNTLINEYFLGEPGLAIFIEEGNKKILFDVGYSDAFIKNALKMNIDLNDLDYVVLSHGHNDHTWGLEQLIEMFSKNISNFKTSLVAHTLTFNAKYLGEEEIGSKITEKQLSEYFEVKLGSSDKFVKYI